MNWREYPMARLLLPLALGIGSEGIVPEQLQWAVLLSLMPLLALMALWQTPGRRFSQRWWFGLALYASLFLFGNQLVYLHDERRHARYLAATEEGPLLLVARACDVEPAGSRLRLLLAAEARQGPSGALQPAGGHILAYFDITSRSRELEAGDVLMLSAKLSPPAAALNPGAFDFQRYLHYRNVHLQAFVGEQDWQLLERRPNLASHAWRLRRHCLQALARFLPSENEYAVAAALILGYKAELSDEVRNAYAHTGAMHVLAVSGLHVGIIQMVLSFLLGLARLPGRFWPLVRAMLLLAGIWGFALLTGASPSVLRAATLFSFLSAGQALRRHVNIYNTLAASAFLLLCADPFLLFNVGFQLSYLAVLGIVYFQPLLYRHWYIKNRAGDYLWKLLSVSLAAQLTTLPISLFYFHQFPLYFWLSGLIVVPAAALILSSGLALFALQAVPLAGAVAGKLLYGITWTVNALIFLVQQIPGGLLQGIWAGPETMILMYLLLLALVLAIESRNFKWILAGQLALLGIAGIYAAKAFQVHSQRALAVYHIPRGTALALFEGRQASYFLSVEVSEQQLDYAALNHRWRRWAGVAGKKLLTEKGQGRQWRYKSGALQYGPHRLLVIRDRSALQGNGRLHVSLALLCGGVDIGLGELLEKVNFRLALIDGSNPPWKARKWLEEARALGVDAHYTAEKGAWEQEW